MADIRAAFKALSDAYNDGEPVGSRVSVEVKAKWHRWCVSCRKTLAFRSKWRVINDHIVCAACQAKGDIP